MSLATTSEQDTDPRRLRRRAGRWCTGAKVSGANSATTEREFRKLAPERLDIVEVSGALWVGWPWRSRLELNYPEFNLSAPPDDLPGPFDLVICEQVLEHVVDPLTAVATLRRLCKPDGLVYVSTPFLFRVHDNPGDYWRFTTAGLGCSSNRKALSLCGFEAGVTAM